MGSDEHPRRAWASRGGAAPASRVRVSLLGSLPGPRTCREQPAAACTPRSIQHGYIIRKKMTAGTDIVQECCVWEVCGCRPGMLLVALSTGGLSTRGRGKRAWGERRSVDESGFQRGNEA